MRIDNLNSPLFQSRSAWNNNDELWPNGFDVWGHGHKNVNGQDVKVPFKRVKEVSIDEL